MASDNQVPLDIVADSKGASKELEAFAKQLNTLFSGLNKTIEDNLAAPIKKVEETSKQSSSSIGSFFTGLKVAAAGALAVIAGRQVIDFFETAIKEASEADQAIASLNFALAATGSFSEEASKGLQDYAGNIQATTTFTDDAVLASLTLGKTFGLSTDKAKELTSAATNLAAVQGISLTAATDKLLGSLNGQGRALKDLGPQFARLTEEQLTNGEAVKLVNERFADAAVTLTGTFSGALTQANNNVSDFYKEFGKTITQNQTVIKAINLVSQAFSFLAEEISKNKEGISAFVSSAVKTLASFASFAVDTIVFLTEGFFNLAAVVGNAALRIKAGFAILTGDAAGAKEAVDKLNNGGSDFSKTAIGMRDGLAKLSSVVTATSNSIQNIDAVSKDTNKTFIAISKSVDTTTKSFGKNREEALKFVAELAKANQTELQKAEGVRNEQLEKIKKFEKEKSLIGNEAAVARANAEYTYNLKRATEQKKAFDEDKERIKKAVAEQTAIVQEAVSNPFKILIENKSSDSPFSKQQIAGIAASFGAAMTKGAEGAKDVLTSGIGAAADTIIPGIGGAVKQIAGVLAEGPEATKQFIREFINAFPTLIDNIIESLPAVVEALVDTLVNKGGAFRIGVSIVKAMTGVGQTQAAFKALGNQIGSDASKTFIDGFKKGLAGFGATISNAVKTAFSGIGSAIAGSIKGAFSSAFGSFGDVVKTALTGGALILFDSISGSGNNIAANFGTSISNAGKDAAGKIVGGLYEGGNNVYENIILAAKRFGNFFSIGEIKLNAGDLVDKLKQAFADIPGQIADAVKGAASVGGSGGGRGVIAETAERVGIRLATGGLVPKGFPDDSFPASLTSGELIVPTDLVSSLSRFLAQNQSGGGGGGDLSAALLAQIVGLLKQPTLVESSINVSGQSFADILLKLSRNNARVAA